MADAPDMRWTAEELEQALGGAGVGVWIYDVADDRVRWSAQLGRLFGVAPADFPTSYQAYLALLPEADRGRLQASVTAALDEALREGRDAPFAVEHAIVRPDGRELWLSCAGQVRVGPDGRVRQMIGTAVDATARHAEQLAQHAREERYRLFTELATDYVYVTNTVDYLPQVVAGSYERTVGMSQEEVAAKGGWLQIVHPEHREQIIAQGARAAAGETVVTEYRIIDGKGETRWLRDTTRPILDENGTVTGLMGGATDITEQKRLADALAHARRLEAVARLAGGVAHDFNNLLSVIFSGLTLLRRHLPEKPAVSALFGDLSDATQRAAALTRSLLTFSRREEPAPVFVAAPELLASLRPIVARLAPASVDLEVAHRGPPAWLRVDREQLERAIVNLVTNALDAMPRGGRLSIISDVLPLGERDPRLPAGQPPGSYLVLSVQDTGTGMDARTVEHVFEPFFTTKPAGRGTGLGMAIAHGAVQQAGGSITVDSKLGEGTRVWLVLPLAPVPARATTQPVLAPPVHGDELLLYVEDEPVVRRMTAQLLRERGYQVLAVSSAEDALALAPAQLADVRLLVTDETLPGCPGSELARKLHERFGLPAVVVSGFIGAETAQTLARRGVRVLTKPHRDDELAQAIREILDRKA